MKSAALIVIGDEILTGKVKDENTLVFASTMFERGIRVARVLVIPDDVPTIAQSVNDYSQSYDYVFTSGGIGPTHDDKTFDGIARAFSLPLVEHAVAFDYFKDAQIKAGRGEVVTLSQRKMLQFPSPCEVHFIEPLWLPLVVVKNVYIFPGVPYLFEKMITGFAYLFSGSKFYRQIIYTDRSESVIAEALKGVQESSPTTAIGSYPQMPGKPFNVMVTIEGVDEALVSLVAQKLIPLIGGRTTALV